MKLIFATRPSALARWQTQWVIHALKNIHGDLECEEKIITTQGDKILDRPLPEIGGSCSSANIRPIRPMSVTSYTRDLFHSLKCAAVDES